MACRLSGRFRGERLRVSRCRDMGCRFCRRHTDQTNVEGVVKRSVKPGPSRRSPLLPMATPCGVPFSNSSMRGLCPKVSALADEGLDRKGCRKSGKDEREERAGSLTICSNHSSLSLLKRAGGEHAHLPVRNWMMRRRSRLEGRCSGRGACCCIAFRSAASRRRCSLLASVSR